MTKLPRYMGGKSNVINTVTNASVNADLHSLRIKATRVWDWWRHGKMLSLWAGRRIGGLSYITHVVHFCVRLKHRDCGGERTPKGPVGPKRSIAKTVHSTICLNLSWISLNNASIFCLIVSLPWEGDWKRVVRAQFTRIQAGIDWPQTSFETTWTWYLPWNPWSLRT